MKIHELTENNCNLYVLQKKGDWGYKGLQWREVKLKKKKKKEEIGRGIYIQNKVIQ